MTRLPTTHGPLHSVACPHCRKPLNFMDDPDSARLTGGFAGAGAAFGLEPGALVVCDHCKRKSQVVELREVTIVRLAPA